MCILIEVKLGCIKHIRAFVLAKCVSEAVEWSWFLRYLANHFSCTDDAKWYVMLIRKEKYCWRYLPLQCARAKYLLKGLKKFAKNLRQMSPFLTGSEPIPSRRRIRNSNHVKAVFNGKIWVNCPRFRMDRNQSRPEGESEIATTWKQCLTVSLGFRKITHHRSLQIPHIMSHYKPRVLARSIGFILIFHKEPVWCVQLQYEYYIQKLLPN